MFSNVICTCGSLLHRREPIIPYATATSFTTVLLDELAGRHEMNPACSVRLLIRDHFFLFADTSDAALLRWNRDHLPHREKLSP